eukprot:3424741-Pyramimonas_sp.AAC.1
MLTRVDSRFQVVYIDGDVHVYAVPSDNLLVLPSAYSGDDPAILEMIEKARVKPESRPGATP